MYKSISVAIAALVWALALSYPIVAQQADASTIFYVAPDGNDTNPGTIDRPLATLAGARDKVRNVKGDVTVYFRDGYYHFKAPVRLGP